MKTFFLSGVLVLFLVATATAQVVSFKVEASGSAVKVTHSDGLKESVEMFRGSDVSRIELTVDTTSNTPIVRVIQNGFSLSAVEYRFPAGATDSANALLKQLADAVFQK